MSSSEEDEWTREDSVEVAESVLPILAMVRALDRDRLARALRELEKWDAAGPVVDPTGYRENMEANDRATERLDALLTFYDALDGDDELDDVEVTLSGFDRE